MKLLTIVGARPQFIKAAAVSRAIRTTAIPGGDVAIEEILLHTGQHFDHGMSQVFFDELSIPAPKYNLGISSLSHGVMTGKMLEGIESVLLEEKPDWVQVYGDTNSTLAGALAAKKLNLRVAHVEAGLRSFQRRMPEEINRILADRISDLLLCPTDTAVVNLKNEGIVEGVHQVGDVMFDASIYFREVARQRSAILRTLQLSPKAYILATVHRAENTDSPERLAGILEGLSRLTSDVRVILALHPRTRKLIAQHGWQDRFGKIEVIEPVPYLDMVQLEESARAICTDSGGVQKEAFFFRVPCVTLREETEWVELVECGWNRLAGADPEKMHAAVLAGPPAASAGDLSFYGDGHAAERIVALYGQGAAL